MYVHTFLLENILTLFLTCKKNNKKDRGYKDIICLLQMWYNYLLFLLLGNFAHNISEKEKKTKFLNMNVYLNDYK